MISSNNTPSPLPVVRSEGQIRSRFLSKLGITRENVPMPDPPKTPTAPAVMVTIPANIPPPVREEEEKHESHEDDPMEVYSLNTMELEQLFIPPGCQSPNSITMNSWGGRNNIKLSTIPEDICTPPLTATSHHRRTSTSSSEKSVQFHSTISVVPIPSHRDLPRDVKSKLWMNQREMEFHTQRNAMEFAFDGWDWRGCAEEPAMIQPPADPLDDGSSASSNPVHPATWMMAKQRTTPSRRRKSRSSKRRSSCRRNEYSSSSGRRQRRNSKQQQQAITTPSTTRSKPTKLIVGSSNASAAPVPLDWGMSIVSLEEMQL